MLQRLDLRGRDLGSRPPTPARSCPRPEVAGEGPTAAVREIIAAVRARGDAALRELTLRFDGCDLAYAPRGTADDRRTPWRRAPPRCVPRSRPPPKASGRSTRPRTRRRTGSNATASSSRAVAQPVDRAGLYVPGGRAVYPSTVLMTAVPARVAGRGRGRAVRPPGRRRVGCPRSRSPRPRWPASTRSTRSVGRRPSPPWPTAPSRIQPVDVIAGPGNVFVAIAKREVAVVVGVPSAFAGPSEIVVVADVDHPGNASPPST